MITDYYTKPLQGSLFKKMRDILMGLTPFPDEERVKLGEQVSTEELKENRNSRKTQYIPRFRIIWNVQ